MPEFIVGVAQLSLRIRHARTLKDRRQVIQAAIQRLRNQGFSVTDCGPSDNPKLANLGMSYAGSEAPQVERALETVLPLFANECEILSARREVFDYSGDAIAGFSLEEEEEDFV